MEAARIRGPVSLLARKRSRSRRSETLDEAGITIDFLTRHRDIIHSSILYQFTLLDHSYIFNNPKEFGITEVQSHGNVFSNVLRYTTSRGMDSAEFQVFYDRTRRRMRREVYQNPFWYHLLIREYLYLFVRKYGKDAILRWKVDPETLRVKDGDEEKAASLHT